MSSTSRVGACVPFDRSCSSSWRRQRRSSAPGWCGKASGSTAGLLWIAGGLLALGAYGFVAAAQPHRHFGRVLAAYGGVFVAAALAWSAIVDGYRPDRWDIVGAAVCLVGVGIIAFGRRGRRGDSRDVT